MKGIFFCLLLISVSGIAQELPNVVEQQLEQIADMSAENDIDITEQEALFTFRLKHPININEDDGTGLQELGIVSPLQIQWLLAYRKIFGAFVDVYELQAVPGWDASTCRSLLPYITINKNGNVVSWKEMLQKGKHQLILRYNTTLEKADGYRKADRDAAPYVGSPGRVLLRYRFQYQQKLQWGLLGEKDAGEPFFKANNSTGFDFVSAHVQYCSNGFIRKVVAGDYTVNMGQGLIQWQGFSIGVDVSGLKQQGEVIRAYGGAGEFAFHRGLAASFQHKNWQWNVFGSFKKLDGNKVEDSSGNYITSIQTGGYHRTLSEIEDKGIVQQLAWGATLHKKFNKMKIGINWIEHRWNMPIQPKASVYNRYYFSGNAMHALSVDAVYYGKHYQVFGEMAYVNGQTGWIGGMMMSTSATTDVGMRFRYLSKKFDTVGNQAFTRSSTVNNEVGCMMLLQIRPHQRLRINATIDIFKFPFFRFGVHGPSVGSESNITMNYKPNKQFEAIVLFTTGNREQNIKNEMELIPPVTAYTTQRFRMHLQWKSGASTWIRTRFETKAYKVADGLPETGSMWYGDVLYQPMGKRYKASARIVFFDTDSYNTRIYAYEQDLHPGNSIPMVYGKGVRLFITGNYKLSNKVTCSFKISRSIYQTDEGIGSGYEHIPGNTKTQVGLQGAFTF